MLNEKQLAEKIYRLKRELEIYEEIYNSKSEGIGRPIGSLEYSDEEIEFLKENKNMHMKNLIPFYNRTFGTNHPENSRALYNLMERQGIIKPVSTAITHNQIRVSKLEEERRKGLVKVNKDYRNERDLRGLDLRGLDGVKYKLKKDLDRLKVKLEDKKIIVGSRNHNKYPKKKEYFADRDKVKQLIKLNYFGTDAEREKMVNFLEVENWSIIGRDLHGVKKKYNFQPSEFGLRQFPNIKGNHMRKEIGRFLL